MNYELINERLRTADSDPLVLSVSAISDFLWPEFVREAKPHVNYVADRFDIRQLSRFGKEVFEFLYCGGDVKPLVSFDAIEEYFRAKQNGEKVTHPKGYKPENALWNQILTDIAEHPQYPVLHSLCLGDHFNSGNNAVCVLNELSTVMENMLETNSAAVAALTEKANELSYIRQKFVQAMSEGKTSEAAELRQQGKELGQQIEEALTDAHSLSKPQIDTSIEQAVREGQELQDALNTLAGDQPGVGVRLSNVEEKNALANRLRNNKKLLEFARRLGAIKQAFTERKRSRPMNSAYSDIVGATMSNDVTRAFPAEIALAGTEAGRRLFALKHSQKTLLTKDFECHTKDIGRGPVVLYIDISGSMAGESELWSKAMAYVVVEECLKTKREAQVHLFDTAINHSAVFKPDAADNPDFLRFMMEWFTRGGTSFDQLMIDASTRQDIDDKADILIITDGECEVSDHKVGRFNLWKDTKNIDVHAFCIGIKARSLHRFCDSVNCVDVSRDAESSELFISAMSD